MDGATTVAAAPSRQADGGQQHVVPTLPARSFQAAASNRQGAFDALAARQPGNVPSSLAVYYAQRAYAALIVSQATHLSIAWPGLRLDSRHHSREQVEAWRQPTGAVHPLDGLAFQSTWQSGEFRIRRCSPTTCFPSPPRLSTDDLATSST
jgi:2,4-dienoyl-CoA reductase-like NADH-dependent reductase (Old Yellow Enzyme family)